LTMTFPLLVSLIRISACFSVTESRVEAAIGGAFCPDGGRNVLNCVLGQPN